MNHIIEEKKSEIIQLCKKYRVETLYLFGSANTDAFNENSDVDFLVSFKNDIVLEEYADVFFDFVFELENLLGRNVDLITEKTLSNPYFIRSIEQTKQLIYAA